MCCCPAREAGGPGRNRHRQNPKGRKTKWNQEPEGEPAPAPLAATPARRPGREHGASHTPPQRTPATGPRRVGSSPRVSVRNQHLKHLGVGGCAPCDLHGKWGERSEGLRGTRSASWCCGNLSEGPPPPCGAGKVVTSRASAFSKRKGCNHSQSLPTSTRSLPAARTLSLNVPCCSTVSSLFSHFLSRLVSASQLYNLPSPRFSLI